MKRGKNIRHVQTRIFIAFVCFLSIFLSLPPFALSDPELKSDSKSGRTVIYFYSSETNINNFKSLKIEFDNYLAQFGPYEFQPFNNRSTFENHIENKDNCLLLLSSWHYSLIYNHYLLRPMLLGVRNGKNCQKRVLVAKAKTGLISVVLQGLASSSSIEHTRSVLTDMLQVQYTTDSINILTVPKDIDALMSVGFGMSKCALTTESSFEKLKNINPMLHKELTIIAQGTESLHLVVAIPKKGFTKKSESLVHIIENMPKNPDGKKKIKMLGLDNWQQIDLSDRTLLECRNIKRLQ